MSSIAHVRTVHVQEYKRAVLKIKRYDHKTIPLITIAANHACNVPHSDNRSARRGR